MSFLVKDIDSISPNNTVLHGVQIQMNSQDLIMFLLPTPDKETQFNSLVYPLPDTP